MKKLIYILFILSFSYQAQAKNPPPGVGTNIPANILIMLDKSGSMDWNISGRTTLEDPTDVEVDSNGNIYILEYGRNRITKWNSSGTYIKDIGQTQSCNRWGGSWFFKISDDKIYIADWDRQELFDHISDFFTENEVNAVQKVHDFIESCGSNSVRYGHSSQPRCMGYFNQSRSSFSILGDKLKLRFYKSAFSTEDWKKIVTECDQIGFGISEKLEMGYVEPTIEKEGWVPKVDDLLLILKEIFTK